MHEGVADGDAVQFTRREAIISDNEGKSTGSRLQVVLNTHTVGAKRLQEKRRQVKPATATNHGTRFTFVSFELNITDKGIETAGVRVDGDLGIVMQAEASGLRSRSIMSIPMMIRAASDSPKCCDDGPSHERQ